MNTLTHTALVSNVTVTHITPLDPTIVRFAITAKIPNGAKRFNEQTLALYGGLLFTRTRKKTKSAIESYMKQYGIELDVHTGIESVTLTGSVRNAHVMRAGELVRELLTSLVVDEREFAHKKQLALEANREGHDNAKRIAHVAFTNTLYAHEPRLTLDTLKEERAHLTKSTKAHIEAFENTLLDAVWFVSIVGDADAREHFSTLIHVLAKRAVPHTRIPVIANPVGNTLLSTPIPGKTNVEVYLGNVCPIRNDDPAFVPLDFGIDVLGKVGGFSGRLMSIVREKEGLTYGIYAQTHAHHKGDAFHYAIRTFFMAKDYERGISATKRELTRIVEKGITDAELRIFTEIHTNERILALESNKSRLSFFHGRTVRGYSETDDAKMEERRLSLTKREVNHALKTYIDPTCLVLSAAGPIDQHGVPIITGAA